MPPDDRPSRPQAISIRTWVRSDSGHLSGIGDGGRRQSASVLARPQRPHQRRHAAPGGDLPRGSGGSVTTADNLRSRSWDVRRSRQYDAVRGRADSRRFRCAHVPVNRQSMKARSEVVHARGISTILSAVLRRKHGSVCRLVTVSNVDRGNRRRGDSSRPVISLAAAG